MNDQRVLAAAPPKRSFMEIDSHVHLLSEKRSPPRWNDIRLTVDAAATLGLDVLCIAEHRDATCYEELVQAIFTHGALGGVSVHPGVRVLDSGLVLSSAAEIALRTGGDVGVHAAPEVLLALRRDKGAYTLAELVEELDATGQPHLVVGHHLYWNGKWISALDAYPRHLHAIELPAKDLGNAERYAMLSERAGLPTVGGSDAHTWLQVGACCTRIDAGDAERFSVSWLKDVIATGRARPEPSPGAARLVMLSEVYRRSLRSGG